MYSSAITSMVWHCIFPYTSTYTSAMWRYFNCVSVPVWYFKVKFNSSLTRLIEHGVLERFTIAEIGNYLRFVIHPYKYSYGSHCWRKYSFIPA